ncbi:AUTS2 isoform 7, partial [Pan troglodytes]
DRSFQTYVKETREVVCYACSHRLADLPPPTESQGQSDLRGVGKNGMRINRCSQTHISWTLD